MLYLVFSFAHPDYWIARYNLNHIYLSQEAIEDYQSRYGYDDFHYLRRLSADAAPAIFENAEKLGYEDENWFLNYVEDTSLKASIWDKQSIRQWNLSRWTAMKLLSSHSAH